MRGVGVFSHIDAQVDPMHRAVRVSIRPVEHGINGGAYQLAFTSGVMAAGLAAGAPIFVFRWPAASGLIGLVRRLRLTANTDGTAFAQGSTIFDMIRGTVPAQYTGGATIAAISGKAGTRATRFVNNPIQIQNSAVGDIAVAGTATLTASAAPAPTLDSVAKAVLVGGAGANPAIALVPGTGLLIDPVEAQPEELQPSEALIIRATVPATGTWKFGIEVGFDAVDPQRFFTQ